MQFFSNSAEFWRNFFKDQLIHKIHWKDGGKCQKQKNHSCSLFTDVACLQLSKFFIYKALISANFPLSWIFYFLSLPFCIAIIYISTSASPPFLELSLICSVLSRVYDSSKSGCSKISERTLFILFPYRSDSLFDIVSPLY